jgi:NAD+ diphosphatase
MPATEPPPWPHYRPNVYAAGPLDRADRLRDDAEWLAGALAAPATRFVPVWRGRHLFDDAGTAAGEAAGPRQTGPAARLLGPDRAAALMARGAETSFLGLRDGAAYFALDLAAWDAPDHDPALAGLGDFADLRQIGPLLPRDEAAILAQARALVHWHGRHRFCGLCGHPTDPDQAGWQRRCRNAECAAPHFPRTDPAVIMLVHDGGERCVLGRNPRFPPGMHSTLAGFVEPGESLEDAVAREVMEEVGLRVRAVAYRSSQPWPFPSSLMLGFTAEADFGPLDVDPQELERADWYSRAWLRDAPGDESFCLPRADSIARRLIEDWLAGD